MYPGVWFIMLVLFSPSIALGLVLVGAALKDRREMHTRRRQIMRLESSWILPTVEPDRTRPIA